MLKSVIQFGVFILFLNLSFLGFGQMSKLQIKGDQFMRKGKYEEAIKYFSNLDDKVKEKEPIHHYYLGMSYYYSVDKKKASIPHLAAYLELTDSSQIKYLGHDHAYYFLGRMYHLTNQFELAKVNYKVYIGLVNARPHQSDEEKSEIVFSIEREIEQCNYGEIAIKNPRNVYIENLGDDINSIYPEYAPVVSQDESTLIFTSRRPDTKGAKYIPGEGYNEDIYQTDLIKGDVVEKKLPGLDSSGRNFYASVTEFSYDNFERMGKGINSEGHDAGIQLGKDDQMLFFYRDSDIWEVSLSDSSDRGPRKMRGGVNSSRQESSIFFSFDGTMLFIVSDRPGGYGGLDIYLSTKNEDGRWGEPKNLGPNINSKFDEDGPFLDPDGQTLYFSSTGNSSIGGYDIFRSRMEEDGWSFPVNLGYPINTPADDIYFTMSSQFNRGYYSSGNLDGKGSMDLYRITFSDQRDPVAELYGRMNMSANKEVLGTLITMTSVDEDELISEKIDTLDSDYFLLLGHGKEYDMSIETEGYAPFQRRFKIPEQEEYFQLYQEVRQEKLRTMSGAIIGQKITVYNAMGNETSTNILYDKATLEQIEAIKKSLNYEGNMEALTDVKFYVSQDSLTRLMAVDTTLTFTFDANTNVSFIEPYGDRQDPNAYRSFNVSLNTDGFVAKGLNIKDGSGVDVADAVNVHNVNGLFYTVQIGVYANPVTPSILLNIEPLNSQITDKGYIRYTTGKFESIELATILMEEVMEKGVVDAYITAYYYGERITITESKSLLATYGKGILYNAK